MSEYNLTEAGSSVATGSNFNRNSRRFRTNYRNDHQDQSSYFNSSASVDPIDASEQESSSYSNGAIRKQNQNYKKNYQYRTRNTKLEGSGRTFNSQRYYNQNPKGRTYQETYDTTNIEYSNNEPKRNENLFSHYSSYEHEGNQPVEHVSGENNSNKKIRNPRFKGNSYNAEGNVSRGSKYSKHSESNTKEYDGEYSNYRYNSNYKNHNFRGYRENRNNNWRAKQYKKPENKKKNSVNQRERLVEMINNRQLDCLVCCEHIKHTQTVWSCIQCFNILHLNCVVMWAQSSKEVNGWRCPACQNVLENVPDQYICFCGKITEPKLVPGILPHSCGDMCLKKGRNCDHKCTIQCHPGPCPECSVMTPKFCGCGATQQIVKCSTDVEIVCESGVCNKKLNCQVHTCASKCHWGPCPPCTEILLQECYCGKLGRKVLCTADHRGSTHFSCDDICDKILSCGNHKCHKKCHPGPCDTCEWDVKLIKSCPCGKTRLNAERSSCLDPVPTCDKICEKLLLCGPLGNAHICKEKCHVGRCPSCPLSTKVKCQCGQMVKEIQCAEITSRPFYLLCERKCNKRRSCGRHRCTERCCILPDHSHCPLPCGRTLSCGQHTCPRTCHPGRCPPCTEVGWEEAACACRETVLPPPVPCGARVECSRPCAKQRPCGHEPAHNCHEGECPPCYALTKKQCFGGHEERSAIPCHQQSFGCGKPCGQPLPCGRHACHPPCHPPPCPTMPCRQPCHKRRALCGHACARPCHAPPCEPQPQCRATFRVRCPCGRKESKKPCVEVEGELKRLQMAHSVDRLTLGSVIGADSWKPPDVLVVLECTDECKVAERNRRLEEALGTRGAEAATQDTLAPRYTEFMRAWARKDGQFCTRVHQALVELVERAEKSPLPTRSHSFPVMNREKRRFVHEYCELFGIESVAYDPEPHRNVVATARKGVAKVPMPSLLEVLQREAGQRKVPLPTMLGTHSSGSSENATVALRLPSNAAKSTA